MAAWISSLFSSSPALSRVRPAGLGVLLVGAALSFGSKAVSRRFPEEKQPAARAAFQISGFVLAIIGFIIAIY